MIGILNYGLGNVTAFSNIYKKLDTPNKIISSAADFKDVKKLILPGVGAFDHAMKLYNDSGFRDTVDNLVLSHKMPVLGVCVGMQMMANSSEEGSEQGLDWIDSRVIRFYENDESKEAIDIPHMGWNDVRPAKNSSLFPPSEDTQRFYFLHSYYFVPSNLDNQIGKTEYGIEFCSAVMKENIFGVQFHPEKSHSYGIDLLKRFSLIEQC